MKVPKPSCAIFDDHEFLSSTLISESVAEVIANIDVVSPSIGLDVLRRDYLLAAGFLKGLMGNKVKQETFNAYRRDVEKYYQWSWLVSKSSVLELKPTDLQDFLKFVTSPPANWQNTSVCNRFNTVGLIRVPFAEWRPFVHKIPKSKALSIIESSSLMALDVRDSYIQQANKDWLKANPYRASDAQISVMFTVMSMLYKHIASEGASEINPWFAMKKRRYVADSSKEVEPTRLILKQSSIDLIINELNVRFKKALSEAEIVDAERSTNKSLARSKSPARLSAEKYARMHFAFSMIFLLYVRVSELCDNPRDKPKMSHFTELDGIWRLKIIGKGDKTRFRTVNASVMHILRQYRLFRGVPADPLPNESIPIIPSMRGNEGISRRALSNIIQECFDIGYELAVANGEDDEASQLKIATTHWLRHTGISIEVNSDQRPIGHTRLEAGHASLDTTSKYHNAQMQDLADSNNVLVLGALS